MYRFLKITFKQPLIWHHVTNTVLRHVTSSIMATDVPSVCRKLQSQPVAQNDSPTLKEVLVFSSETLMKFHNKTWRYVTEDSVIDTAMVTWNVT